MFFRGLIFLICLNGISSDLDSDYETDSEERTTTTTREPGPYFEDNANSTEVTAHLGSTVFLNCRVNLLKDKTVSWLKSSSHGVDLLTFGIQTYSRDERLSIRFEQPNNWKLKIDSVSRDEHQGLFQCQVSSHPPLILYVNLQIIVPKIRIVDDLDVELKDKFYNAGSTLELRCKISQFPILHPILWKQGNKTLNYDTSRGGISVKTTVNKDSAVSKISIANSKQTDSGPFSCSLGNLIQKTVHVHVINGESPAAMKHSAGTSLVPSNFFCSFSVIVIHICFQISFCKNRVQKF